MPPRQHGSFKIVKGKRVLVEATQPPKDGHFGPRDSDGKRLDIHPAPATDAAPDPTTAPAKKE